MKKYELLQQILEQKEDIPHYYEEVCWWSILAKHTNLTNGFIREFQVKIDWSWLSSNTTLSENIMREFRDLLDWNPIIGRNRLSESFIRDHLDILDISIIFLFQIQLNSEFLQELKEYLEELKIRKPYLPFETNDNCNICFIKGNSLARSQMSW